MPVSHSTPRHKNVNSAATAKTTPGSASSRPSILLPTPRPLQQTLLNAFVAAFPTNLDPSSVDQVLQPLLQQVKHHLYHRDFAAAFSRPDLLHAYAVRWSASRTLGYLDIFRNVLPVLKRASPDDADTLTVTCLGGGAGAEVVALAGLLAHERASRDAPSLTKVAVNAVDVAEWSPLLTPLHQTLAHDQQLHGVDAHSFALTCLTLDVLDSTPSLWKAIATSQLVTLMFTLNELYSASIAKTQKLLLDLTNRMAAASFLLVVDSPGSYSTVGLSGSTDPAALAKPVQQRKYPMSWLLDHVLLKTAAEASPAAAPRAEGPWQKIESVESQWFRLPSGLDYPIPLENMRYQLHLFQRQP